MNDLSSASVAASSAINDLIGTLENGATLDADVYNRIIEGFPDLADYFSKVGEKYYYTGSEAIADVI
jgi:hypothetical protein